MLTWVVYFAGQLLHTVAKANLSVKSKLSGASTYRAYFAAKWLPIVVRLFLATCLFVIFSEMQPVFNSFYPGFLPNGGSPMAKAAIAGVFGYGSDSILDKIFAKAGLDKEIPPEQ